MSVITKAAIIYMKIYLAYEEHVYKRPTQHNVSMANACNATLKGKRRQYDIIHNLGIGQMYKYTIYKIQNDMRCKSYVPAIIYMKIYLAYEEHVYKRPTQHNVSMANALKRCTDGRM